jgi:hypothetical protein
MGVDDVNVKVNATFNKSKSAKLAKLVKLAKSTNLWCLSPYVLLSQEARDKDKQRQRKVCPVNLQGEVCTADNCGSKHPQVCLVADHGKGKIPKSTCLLWHMRIPRKTPPVTTSATTTPDRSSRTTSTSPGLRQSAGPRSSRQE